MSNTPKFWLGPGELLEWIGEANLSRDENSVVIAVSADAVLNADAQWYESHWEASVEMAVWKRRCDHLLVISCNTWVREYGGGDKDIVESGSISLFTVE